MLQLTNIMIDFSRQLIGNCSSIQKEFNEFVSWNWDLRFEGHLDRMHLEENFGEINSTIDQMISDEIHGYTL